MNTLPVKRVVQLPEAPLEKRWLIQDLWSFEAVGIIGGEPKCGKSILALSVAVAGGAPCLGRFKVNHPGRVLVFAAEDPLHVVRARIAAIAQAHQLSLAALDILVITRSTLRLDQAHDYELLKNTVDKAKPTLLILDPFVRLHRVDENAAAEVAPILSQLRYLQRTFKVSVVLVHHARKDSRRSRQGQALRGSSEFHAWGDSNLYLQRKADVLTLSVEHRAEQPLDSLTLEIANNHLGPFHRIIDNPLCESIPQKISPIDKIRDTLATANSPLNLSTIRASTRLRTASVSEALRTLVNQTEVTKSQQGYSLAK